MSATTDPYSAQLVALQSREEELRQEIAAASEAETVALREHVKKRPTIRPFGDLTSDAWKARRKREKLQKEMDGLLAELPLMHQAAVNATRERAVADLAKYAAQLRSLEAAQPEVWDRLRALYRELLVVYTVESTRIKEGRREIDVSAKALCDNHGDLREQWENTIYPAEQVRPLPSSLASCLRDLERDAFNDPEFARSLSELPKSFIPTGIGAALPGPTAPGFGAVASEAVTRNEG